MTVNLAAEQVISDYLHVIWSFAREEMATRMTDLEEDYDFHISLTIPAIWEGPAQDTMRRAAAKARLPKSLSFVREPEAAALAVLRERANVGTLKVSSDVPLPRFPINSKR